MTDSYYIIDNYIKFVEDIWNRQIYNSNSNTIRIKSITNGVCGDVWISEYVRTLYILDKLNIITIFILKRWEIL